MNETKQPECAEHPHIPCDTGVPQVITPVKNSSMIITDSLGFRLEASIVFENIERRGQHKTYERDGIVAKDVVHSITIADRLRDDELAEVIAHEAYHLFESVRPLIRADEETQAVVFGQLVAKIHAAARANNADFKAMKDALETLDSLDWTIGYELTEANMKILDKALQQCRTVLANETKESAQ